MGTHQVGRGKGGRALEEAPGQARWDLLESQFSCIQPLPRVGALATHVLVVSVAGQRSSGDNQRDRK